MKKALVYASLLIGVPVVLVLTVFWFQRWRLYNATPSKLVVSKETTWFTDPLDDNGYVNYKAAINEYFGKDVTPEDNAYAVVLSIVGPHEDARKEDLQRLCQILGIEPLPKKGDYFLCANEFFQEKFPSDEKKREKAEDNYYQRLTSMARHPWKEKDYPLLAQWLERNDKHIDRLVVASQCEKWFQPVAVPDGEAFLYDATGDFSRGARESFGPALAARATLRLGKGDVSGAWNDIAAAGRLARLLSTSRQLMDRIHANVMMRYANNAMATLLTDPRVTPEQRKSMLAEHQKANGYPPLKEIYDTTERWGVLDQTIALVRNTSDGELEEAANIDPAVVDLNISLPIINRYYDQLCIIAQEENRIKRTRLEDTLCKELESEGTDYWRITIGTLAGQGRHIFSEMIAHLVLSIAMPGVTPLADLDGQREMELQMLHVIAALCDYRDKHGDYPEKLESLVPASLEAIPVDSFDEKGGPLRYRKTPEGFRIYSLGRNGKDDGGRLESEAEESGSESDDVIMVIGEGQ